MAFEELKERHAAMWGSAPFERVAGTLADMHERVVETMVGGARGEPGSTSGCGTGELAFMAAATGADVTACDLAPNLVETARRQAAERGLEIPFEVGDAEALPYGDASFDIVTSSIGAIFAPNHDAVASELARVCRPGGRLGMTAWTKAEGGVDKFFEIIGSYAPPPPPGAGIPFEWGEPAHCEELLGAVLRARDHLAQHALAVRDARRDVGPDVGELRPDQDTARRAPPGTRCGVQGRACSSSSSPSGPRTGSTWTGPTT